MDATSEFEDKYRSISETRIREAMEAGEFDNLEGIGQRVEVEENPFVPDEWRIAFHVLKQNGFKPEWIELTEQIDNYIARWRLEADRHFDELRIRLAAVASNPQALRRLQEEVATLKLRHRRAAERHATALDEINRKIHYYNATVPIQSLQRPTFNREDEMKRFADRMPAYLLY